MLNHKFLDILFLVPFSIILNIVSQENTEISNLTTTEKRTIGIETESEPDLMAPDTVNLPEEFSKLHEEVNHILMCYSLQTSLRTEQG